MKTLRYILTVFAFAAIVACGKSPDAEPSGQNDDNNTSPPVLVSEITLNQKEATLFKEGTISLTATIAPENADNKEIYWNSSAPNIASVNNKGEVTAHSEGETIITALTADQSKYATCKITVRGLYSILFIGNSYTQEGIETHFLNLLHQTDVRNKVRITWMHKFGLTIKGHNTTYATDKSYNRHRYAPGSSDWTRDNGEACLQDVLKGTEFDLIVLQENPVSQEGWEWNSTRKSEVEELINKIKSDQKGQPKFACIMGQAYADPNKVPAGYNTNAKNILTNSFGGKQINMYHAIIGHTQGMIAAIPFEFVIPWGTTLQNLRTSSLNSTHKMDMTTNGVFADLGVGRYAAACTVFESIFTPVFGINLDGVTYTDNTSLSQDTGNSKYKTAITSQSAAIGLNAARLAIKKPYEISVID
ncbi:DUF4886 domain-containing protein [Pseudopedobacter beijingensis]|uniref:DUF4886 domain-containing protein n=1 Tax=Pseudopedobacter beijingensis TaxID=1207056 RepID=A0ABW4I9E6_9SPHI